MAPLNPMICGQQPATVPSGWGVKRAFRYAMCRCSPVFRMRMHLGEGRMRRQTREWPATAARADKVTE
jgi:hypothetical protein